MSEVCDHEWFDTRTEALPDPRDCARFHGDGWNIVVRCSRCGTVRAEHPEESLIQNLVCEIEERLRVNGPHSIEGLERYLVEGLGAPPKEARYAVARWGR
ncbi:MAG: hypothetical protein JNK30_21140 [Phenylobacterium sp.]|uniref:hypothetical protein n=1 Tax=Phenylobacterium sp. TaxID=1871053 RepID=UPI001A51113A|nr:hypothetical protein [Phenylobacterium sp.]MBL8773906.1 hypothetical protein [Phenylobacterium sp.]